MTNELKPCPFCGGRAKGREPEVNIDYVSCSECLACTPNEDIWNTRAVPDVPELVRYDLTYNMPFGEDADISEVVGGEYVRYDQVAEYIAHLEAKLAEYEKQEPFGYLLGGNFVFGHEGRPLSDLQKKRYTPLHLTCTNGEE